MKKTRGDFMTLQKELDSLAVGRNKKTGLTKEEESYLTNLVSLQETVA